MNHFRQVNLIYLISESEIDSILFDKESMGEDELHPFDEHQNMLNDLICKELRISDIVSKFIPYNWYGRYNNLPWNANCMQIPFDPRLINVIVPLNSSPVFESIPIQIRGENRKVVLTFPPTYEGKQPQYLVVCASEKQLEDVHILNRYIGNPFRDLEKLFMPKGFDSLPRLMDIKGQGIVHIDEQRVIIPETCTVYF